jgi:signal transduction histidine kinase
METEEPIISLNKSPFFRKAFHDLRNPIVVIKGYTALMLDGCGGDLTEDQREWVEDMKRNADHLLEIINALGELSFLEAGITTEEKTSFNFGETFRSVIAELEPLAKVRELSWEVVTPERPMTFFGDERLVKKVLSSILHNAVLFSRRGGLIKASINEENDLLYIMVSDSGAGIDRDKIPAVLEGFFKGDVPPEGEFKGTGLSLLIARKIVELYGGTVGIESEPGKGSTFIISMKRGI